MKTDSYWKNIIDLFCKCNDGKLPAFYWIKDNGFNSLTTYISKNKHKLIGLKREVCKFGKIVGYNQVNKKCEYEFHKYSKIVPIDYSEFEINVFKEHIKYLSKNNPGKRLPSDEWLIENQFDKLVDFIKNHEEKFIGFLQDVYDPYLKRNVGYRKIGFKDITFFKYNRKYHHSCHAYKIVDRILENNHGILPPNSELKRLGYEELLKIMHREKDIYINRKIKQEVYSRKKDEEKKVVGWKFFGIKKVYKY